MPELTDAMTKRITRHLGADALKTAQATGVVWGWAPEPADPLSPSPTHILLAFCLHCNRSWQQALDNRCFYEPPCKEFTLEEFLRTLTNQCVHFDEANGGRVGAARERGRFYSERGGYYNIAYPQAQESGNVGFHQYQHTFYISADGAILDDSCAPRNAPPFFVKSEPDFPPASAMFAHDLASVPIKTVEYRKITFSMTGPYSRDYARIYAQIAFRTPAFRPVPKKSGELTPCGSPGDIERKREAM